MGLLVVKLKERLNNLSLSKKVIYTTMAMTLMLMFFLSAFLFQDSNRSLNEQAELILDNTAEKNHLNFNYSITEIENRAFEIISSEEFTEYLQRYATDQALNDNPFLDFQMSLMPKLRQILGDSRKIAEIQLVLADTSYSVGFSSFKMGPGFVSPENILDYGWRVEGSQLLLALPFNSFEMNLQKRGYLRLVINPERFFQSISETDELQNGFIITDQKGQLLYDPLKNFQALEAVQRIEQENKIISTADFFLKKQMLANGWQATTYYSRASFRLDIREFIQRVLIAAVIIVVVSFTFGRVISQWLVRPILSLNRQMRRSKRTLPTPIVVTRQDEVGELSKTYNEMAEDLKQLFQEKQLEERAKHDAELSAYQSQIQPHFLYNTLAIISWTAKKGDLLKVEEITKNLAKYYRLVLAKGKRITSLQDELDLVRYYLEIQKIRFSDQLVAEIQVDPGIKTDELYIMHRILQPMVENALEHGIFPKGSGSIQVTVCQTKEKLWIYVADNGAGASAETVERINRLQGKDEPEGFSLITIIRALKSYYGAGIEVTFDSLQGEGTLVSIVVEKGLLKQSSEA
ncbi:sensor histidine kinase [Enterococcus faecium]